MSASAVTSLTPAEPPSAAGGAPASAHKWWWHAAVALLALCAATWLTHGLWQDPQRHAIAVNQADQAFFEWLLGYGVHVWHHGADPYFAEQLNRPLGVNLAVNTSITVYSLLFAPLTMSAGPQVTFVTILTLNLAGGAFAWYLFLARYVVANRAAAAVAGLFAGFAPGFVSHANSHLNWSAGWVAPVVLWWVLKLREPGHRVRNGVVLGLLVTIGFSVAAEGLFFTALACGVFLGTWALARATRDQARAALPHLLASLAVTALVAGALLAYPLYMHFAGPQSFSGTGFNQREFSEDVGAYVGYASRSLAALVGLGSDLAPNPTEETTFFGAPLIILIGYALAALWRRADPGGRATLRALMVTMAVFVLLSLGPRLKFFGTEYDVPLPYAVLERMPLFDSALPGRFALVVVGVFAVLLAMVGDRLIASASAPWWARGAWSAGLALALLPIVPTVLPHRERTPEAAFIADGTYRDFLPEGGVLTALPIPSHSATDAQRWQAYTMARGERPFGIPSGYFLGPGGPNGTGRIGPPRLRTAGLFQAVAHDGVARPITDRNRSEARNDLQYWGVQLVVLPDATNRGPQTHAALLTTATELLGPPQRVSDVYLWRIRPGVDPVDPPETAPGVVPGG